MVTKNELDACNELLSKIKEILTKITISTEISDRLSNLNIAITFLATRFAREEAIFLPPNIFTELKNSLSSLHGILQRYLQLETIPSATFLNETQSFFNVFSKNFASIPFFQEGDYPALLETYHLVLEQTKNKILKYEEKISELSSKINNLMNQSTEIERKVDNTLQTVTRSQESQSNQFKQSEEGRSITFSNTLKQCESDFKRELNDIKVKHEQHHQQLKETLDSTKTICNEKLEEITKILAIAANTSLSGVSGNYANYCKDSALWLFRGALALMALGAIVLIIIFWNSFWGGTVTFGVVAFRLSFAIPLFLPAFYCACKAKRMEDKEQYYRDFSIKVATIPPYLNGVDTKTLDKSGQLLKTEEEKLVLLHHLITESKFKSSKEPVMIPKDMRDLITQVLKITSNK